MSETLRILAHDLRGPVLTIDGFATELALAATALAEAVGQGGAAADADALRQLVLDVVQNDLGPCLSCIAAAAAMLGERIDALDGAGGDAGTDAGTDAGGVAGGADLGGS